MLALRRGSLPLRNRGLSIRASGAACPDSERLITHIPDKAGIFDSSELASHRCLSFKGFYRKRHVSANLFLVRRSLSSQAGARSSGDEDDLEDGFSELEAEDSAKAVQGSNAENDNEDDLIAEPDFPEDNDAEKSAKNELDISDAEADLSEKVPSRKWVVTELFKVITAAQGSVCSALDKWVKEGNEVNCEEISVTMLSLCKFRMFGRALEFSEWLEASKKIEFLERHYATRVDLIAKVKGLDKAEKYIDLIPICFRGELIYRSFLTSCVQALNVKKAEKVFNKIKDLQLPITTLSCDQMLILYKRTNKKKIADVLVLMEEENITPSLFTYRLLIDTKGQNGDITGMEQILEMMKAEGIEPDTHTNTLIAGHYSSAGLKEKAEAVLKHMERGNLNKNRHVCPSIVRVYADLGRADEVERVWKVCKSNPRVGECIAVMEAWGTLKKIKEAEAVFKKMLKVAGKPTSLHYNVLLKVYAENKMLTKGKDLIKHMADSGCKIGPVTWDLLVKLYLEAGDINKAESVLQKAAEQNPMRPLFSTYMAIMDQYAGRGDTHNAEKMYFRLKQAGFSPRFRQFQTLVKAYINAKAPLYAVQERMKADNIIPNKGLAGQLPLVDAFRKTAVYDLLD